MTIDYHGQLFTGDVVTPAIARASEIAKAYGLALIKARTPIDSGALKANWQARLEGNGIRWLNPTTYAGYVEFGTKKMNPRNMLGDSLPEITQVFEDELYRELGKSMGASIVAEVSQPSYGNQGTPKQKTLPGGRAFESPLVNALRPNALKNRKNQTPGRTDLLTPSQTSRIAKVKPKWQKKALQYDQQG